MATLDKKTLVGVFSGFTWMPNGTKGCASPNPNIFTRVSHYLDFIRSELGQFTKNPFQAGEHPSTWDESAN